MTIPTGHKTFTHIENVHSRGELFRGAREGDTYIDRVGKHWECRGTFVKPAPPEVAQDSAPHWASGFHPRYGGTLRENMEQLKNGEASARVHAMAYGLGVQAQNLSAHWRQERGIPAGVEIRYETSYTKKVVDGLVALGAYRNTFPAMRAAIDLLKDYHKSLHAPYEQRDKARDALADAQAQLQQAQQRMRMLARRRIRFLNRYFRAKDLAE